jgi:predicted GNAT family acetyltransferase
MTAPSLIFKYLGHTKRDDGLIRRYNLEVTDSRSGKTVTISVEPKHLASARSMKRILLDRCMFYRATRAEHDEMLLKILDLQSEALQE